MILVPAVQKHRSSYKKECFSLGSAACGGILFKIYGSHHKTGCSNLTLKKKAHLVVSIPFVNWLNKVCNAIAVQVFLLEDLLHFH